MMSDGENNENTKKEEVPMETGVGKGDEEKPVDISTESKDEEGEDGDVGDTGTGEEEEPSGADTSTDSPSKGSPSKDSPAKDSPSKDTPEKKKNSVKKTPKKAVTSEDEEENEERLGLLERPVIIESGKREKRKVERLEMTSAITPNAQKKIEVHEGSGVKLGDCPRIEQRLQKIRGEDLKTLHKVLFGRIAAASVIKRNIRQFSGFPFKKEDKEYDRKLAVLVKLNLSVLKSICDVLDVERGGTKDSIVNRILEFLLCPRSSGKKVPAPKRKRKSSGKGDKAGGKPKKKRSSKKAEKKLDDDVELSESEESEEEEEPDEKGDAHPEEDEASESEEEEAPKKKKRKVEKTPKKEKPVKEVKKKKEKPEKKAKEKPEKEVKQKKEKSEKKEKKAASPKKQKVSKVEEDSSDEDEPLSKKQSNEPPSDEEVKECIKKILEGANLEEVTMKTVLKQVYDTYPDFDLSDRKTFIKNTVKQLIS